MKRWLALGASILIQSCLGVVYAWSTFVPALGKEHGLTSGHAGLIFGICIASFTVSMVFGGILQHKYGPRRIAAIGGLLFLAGYLTGSFSDGNFPLLLIGFGVLAGAGIGFGYVCPLATGIKWFPTHKGLITGLTVAGFGLGAVFFAKAGHHFLDTGVPVLLVLQRIGWFVGVSVGLGALFLFVPKNAETTFSNPRKTEPLRALLKRREFKFLFGMMFCGTFGGLLVIGNLKPIGLSLGLSTAQATFSIMLFAVGNAAGRVLWGLLYDRFGGRVMMGCMILLAAGAGLMGLCDSKIIFYLSSVLIAFAFGGFFVLFAAQVADSFGTNRLSEVYPFVFLGYGIAGLAGPPIGGALLHISNSSTFATASVVAVATLGAITAKIYTAGKPRETTN